jgi:hypothetical protein
MFSECFAPSICHLRDENDKPCQLLSGDTALCSVLDGESLLGGLLFGKSWSERKRAFNWVPTAPRWEDNQELLKTWKHNIYSVQGVFIVSNDLNLRDVLFKWKQVLLLVSNLCFKSYLKR